MSFWTLHNAQPSLQAEIPAEQAELPARHRDTVRKGVVAHLPHALDSVLAQGAYDGLQHFGLFRGVIDKLVGAAKCNCFPLVNEKVDGSISLVLGFHTDGRPFVSYKGSFLASKQLLMFDMADPLSAYPPARSLRNTLACLTGPLLEAMRTLPPDRFRDHVFQGDLLFLPNDPRRRDDGDRIILKPNAVTYVIDSDSPIYQSVKEASLGIVVHMSNLRGNGADGRLTSTPDQNVSLIEEFTSCLSKGPVFAVHPFRRELEVGRAKPLGGNEEAEILDLLSRAEAHLLALGEGFREEFRKHHLDRFRPFFNAQVRPPHTGGIYRAAAAGEEFDSQRILDGFDVWLRDRITLRPKLKASGEEVLVAKDDPKYAAMYYEFRSRHCDDLLKLLEAYFFAARAQSLVSAHVGEALKSKLGGGPVEGLIFEEGPHTLKFVDRMSFTMANNVLWNRSVEPRALEPLPKPFDVWQPGASFAPMRLQPLHIGHVEMLKAAARTSEGPVYVVASVREPNLDADNWKDLGAASKRGLLARREYECVFTNSLRQRLLKIALGDENINFKLISPNELWRYVSRAAAEGKEGQINLVFGERDRTSYDAQLKTYPGQLRAVVIPEQEGAISGTAVRQALKEYALAKVDETRAAPREVLRQALSYVKDDQLFERLLREMALQWRRVDRASRRILKATADAKRRPVAESRAVPEEGEPAADAASA